MFQLEDLRKTRVWQEALEEGLEHGRTLEKKRLVRKWLAKGHQGDCRALGNLRCGGAGLGQGRRELSLRLLR